MTFSFFVEFGYQVSLASVYLAYLPSVFHNHDLFGEHQPLSYRNFHHLDLSDCCLTNTFQGNIFVKKSGGTLNYKLPHLVKPVAPRLHCNSLCINRSDTD